MKSIFALSAVAAIAFAASAHAHHSFAMFDRTINISLEGTVEEFELTNPHSWLYVITEEPDGTMAEWTIEMGSPGGMGRAGWEADTLMPGDEITVEIHPLKDGTYGGQYLEVVLPDGTVMGGGDSGIAPLAR
jgi:hypothetical protein